MKDVQKFKIDFKGSTCNLTLLLEPEMLTVVDLQKFRGFA